MLTLLVDPLKEAFDLVPMQGYPGESELDILASELVPPQGV